MADIVVCGDLEHEIERTGELKRLKALGSVEIFNELDPARETLVSRLHGTRAILEVRGRAALDRETLRQLPDLEIIASTGPHRIVFEAASELGIVVATTPAVSTTAVADFVCALVLALARHICSADGALRRRTWEPVADRPLFRTLQNRLMNRTLMNPRWSRGAIDPRTQNKRL
jgi:phosphoglycerate dehydrogenase-like enzyme